MVEKGPKVARMLRLRKSKLLPQQVSDLGAFIFVVAMIPVTYLWEVLVVSQALFPEQEQAVAWAGHMLFGLLVVVNIAGNFAGTKIGIEKSLKGAFLCLDVRILVPW